MVYLGAMSWPNRIKPSLSFELRDGGFRRLILLWNTGWESSVRLSTSTTITKPSGKGFRGWCKHEQDELSPFWINSEERMWGIWVRFRNRKRGGGGQSWIATSCREKKW